MDDASRRKRKLGIKGIDGGNVLEVCQCLLKEKEAGQQNVIITIAVDATKPIVPIGTQIIMNGVLYTVEDTGNFARYGVDFDVYYDSHSAPLAHGHRTWQAYYAGVDGESIEVTTTETVKVCYVTLTVTDFESILAGRLDEEQTEMYDIYQETRGNRVTFGTTLDFNWHLYITGEYGYTDEDDGEDYDLPDAYDGSDYPDEDDSIFEDDEPVRTGMTGICLEQPSGCFT